MPKRVTKRMLDAARMIAEGKTTYEAADAVGVDVSTVRRWLRDESVQAEFAACVRSAAIPMVARSLRCLDGQIDSDAGNGFLAQNAANILLSRFGPHVLGEDRQEITVTVVGGMPEMGMPDASD